MDNIEREWRELRAKLKQLNAKRYKRFNVLLKTEAFKKLEQEAKRNKTSKAKMLGAMIKQYNKVTKTND